MGEKTKQKQNPDLQHMIRRQISRISTANQQYNDIFQSTKETANIITGVARPSGAHGQGTVSIPHTNGIILVGGGGGGAGHCPSCPPTCYAPEYKSIYRFYLFVCFSFSYRLIILKVEETAVFDQSAF